MKNYTATRSSKSILTSIKKGNFNKSKTNTFQSFEDVMTYQFPTL